jgi:1,4-alpha-glucan branching enzyme
MSLKKQYLKSRPVCKVTFQLPAEAAKKAKKVALVGEFNNWKKPGTPMRKLKDGSFKVTVDLEPGKTYQYRYLIDQKTWENDWEADAYTYSGIGADENSMVII